MSFLAEYSSKLLDGILWFFTGSERIVKPQGGPSNQVAVQLSSERIYYFTESGGDYTPIQDTKATLTLVEDPDCQFVFKDCRGKTYRFNMSGQLIDSNSGNDEVVTNRGSGMLMDSGPVLSQVRTTIQDGVTYENRLDYAYDGDEQLIEVVSSLVNVTTSTTSLLRRQVLTYYGPAEDHGSDGDLKTSTIQLPDGAGGWVDHETTYMRYYKAGDADGFAHALKYLVRPEAFRRLSLVGSPLTAANSLVAQYADNYYEYDGNQRAKKSVTNGGLLTYTMAYTVSAHADAYNNWKLKTVVTRPDGATETTYSNYLTQQLLTDLAQGANHWVNYWQYNSRGYEILHAMPSAVVSYNEASANLGVTLQTASGLSMVTDYYSSTTATVSTPGGVIDEVSATWLRKGSGGGAVDVKQSALTYYWRNTDNGFIWPVAAQTTYRDDGATDAITTSYAYTWYTDSTQILQRVTTLPVITTAQNGSNAANARRELYDMYGNLQATQDERGFINSSVYFWALNARTKSVQDDDAPSGSGWTANSGTRLKLTSDYQYDDLGRITQSLGPARAVDLNGISTSVRTASWMVYQDAADQVWSGQGFATGTGPSYTYTLVNPVTISVTDDAGRTTDSITATRASTAGKLLASDTFPQSSWVRWSTTQYNNQNQQTSSRQYWHIPASGTGTVNTNYYETTYGYDVMNRQNRVVNTVGTISRIVYDVRNLTVSTWIGTNDAGATDSDPDGSGEPNNMLQLSANVYDGGADEGDGNLTQSTQYVDASGTKNRVTSYVYDWRNRQTTIDGEIDVYVEQVYDNLNQITQINRKNTTSGGNLIGRSETFFDNLGRTYQSKVYAVDPTTGTVGNALTDNTWYDPTGNVLKSKPAGSQAWTKMVYDSVGRNTIRYVGYSTATENYAEAGTISTSIVMEQTVTTYDAASNAIQTESAQRYHDAPATGTGSQGVLNGPTGSNPKSRNSYVASYPDGIGRNQAVANYGTNDNTSFTRPATIPPRSDTVLVNSTDYNSTGEAWQSVDPAGQVTRQEFDDLGRRTRQIQNYVACGHASGQNITTEWTYTPHSQIATLTAVNAATGNQITSYGFGVTVVGGSDYNSNDPLHTETYPDAGVVIREYNRAGQVIEITDQNGTVHALDYDKLGRSVADRVVTVPYGIELIVLRIETSYEVRGLVEHITQYDAATGGNVVNDILRQYNAFSQLITEYQQDGGPVIP